MHNARIVIRKFSKFSRIAVASTHTTDGRRHGTLGCMHGGPGVNVAKIEQLLGECTAAIVGRA